MNAANVLAPGGQRVFSAFAATAVGACLWGTLGPLMTLYPADAGPAFSFLRLLLGAVLLALFSRVTPRVSAWSWRDSGMVLLGGIGVAGYQPLYFSSVFETGVAVATFVSIGAAPLITGLAALVRPGRRPTPLWWSATALAVTGIVVLCVAGANGGTVTADGVALAVGAGVAYSLQAISLDALGRRYGSARAVATIFIVGCVMLAPFLYGQDFSWLSDPTLVLGVVYAGALTLMAAYALFSFGVRVLGSPTAVTVSLLEPVAAALIGVTLLNERLVLLQWLGCIAILVGVLLLGARRRRRAEPLAT